MKQDRETLWNWMLEKDEVYVEYIQMRIYMAASEEGSSTTQTSIAKGPPPGAQNPALASCLQARSLVRQGHIVLGGREEAVSQPHGAARE